jgi:sugar phosphate isomerase/epimerase
MIYKLKNIYLSTTFAKNNSKVSDILSVCKKENITNIELGSNHSYEKNFDKIVKKYKFCYIVHNYFPIPKKSFVVNIASSNKKIRDLSIKHVKKAISFCKKTNSKLYTFHPGFIGDPLSASNSKKNYDFIWDKKNKKITYKSTFNLMLISLREIINFAKKKNVRIAIETEGSSKKNSPLLMQKPQEFINFFKYFSSSDIGINLNIGHLNLASKTYNFSRQKFVNKIKPYVVALELSHNNRIQDEHLPLKKNMWYWKVINDPYFSKVYKILEFRNTNIKKIKKNIKYFV